MTQSNGVFLSVNFIFLIVGHTKHAADRLFNSLKVEFRKQNVFTVECFVDVLNTSESVSVISTLPDDFFDYDKLFKDMYTELSGKVKVNHIFSCSGDDPEVTFMDLRQSNLEEHVSSAHKVAYSACLRRMN